MVHYDETKESLVISTSTNSIKLLHIVENIALLLKQKGIKVTYTFMNCGYLHLKSFYLHFFVLDKCNAFGHVAVH